MTIQQIHQKAAEKLFSLTLEELLAQWNEVNKLEVTPEVAQVRGWISNALEAKNPEAFEAWMMDDDCPEDPTPFFK